MERTWDAVRLGATESMSETTPVTMGAERLVPCTLSASSLTGTVVPLFPKAKIRSLGCPIRESPPGALIVTEAPELL